MIAFTVSLTPNDWDRNIRGWRCPVLQIPGAEVRGLYAGQKLDDARYQVDIEQRFIRWAPTEEPPESAALAINLTQPLAPKKERDFWQGFGIVVPVIVALIAAGGSYAVQRLKTEPAVTVASAPGTKLPNAVPAIRNPFSPQHYFEKWTVTGRVSVKGEADPFHIQARVFPPEMAPGPTGIFQTLVAVEHLDDDTRRFPSITFQSKLPGYTPVTVELGGDGQARMPATPGASQAGTSYRPAAYEQKIDVSNRRIDIVSPIVVSKEDAPYEAGKAAEQQRRALGPRHP